jgi:hypothetical protein
MCSDVEEIVVAAYQDLCAACDGIGQDAFVIGVPNGNR